LIDYRAGWTWSDLTSIKAQQNLRGFIRICCKGNHRTDLLDSLGTLKETKQGRERRKPKPFTEKEIQKLLTQVPVTFSEEKVKIPRHQTMIRAMVSTGIAIVDAVQLQRHTLERAQKTGVLEVERQKTGNRDDSN
jgi:site-specific recombinase XerD